MKHLFWFDLIVRCVFDCVAVFSFSMWCPAFLQNEFIIIKKWIVFRVAICVESFSWDFIFLRLCSADCVPTCFLPVLNLLEFPLCSLDLHTGAVRLWSVHNCAVLVRWSSVGLWGCRTSLRRRQGRTTDCWKPVDASHSGGGLRNVCFCLNHEPPPFGTARPVGSHSKQANKPKRSDGQLHAKMIFSAFCRCKTLCVTLTRRPLSSCFSWGILPPSCCGNMAEIAAVFNRITATSGIVSSRNNVGCNLPIWHLCCPLHMVANARISQVKLRDARGPREGIHTGKEAQPAACRGRVMHRGSADNK